MSLSGAKLQNDSSGEEDNSSRSSSYEPVQLPEPSAIRQDQGLLNPSEYFVWKKRMIVRLGAKGLLSCIESADPVFNASLDLQPRYEALDIIYSHLAKPVVDTFVRMSTDEPRPYALWRALAGLMENHHVSITAPHWANFSGMELSKFENLAKYCTEFIVLHPAFSTKDCLPSCDTESDVNMQDQIVTNFLIAGLQGKSDSFVKAKGWDLFGAAEADCWTVDANGEPKAEPSFFEVLGQLLEHEMTSNPDGISSDGGERWEKILVEMVAHHHCGIKPTKRARD